MGTLNRHIAPFLKSVSLKKKEEEEEEKEEQVCPHSNREKVMLSLFLFAVHTPVS